MRYKFVFLFFLSSYLVVAQKISSYYQVDERAMHHWVDSVYKQLTFEEKLGQLFMVAAYSNKNETHYKQIDELVEKYKIGGVIFFQGGPVRQATLTNRYQAKSKVPMLIGIDAEWGLAMRLDSTYRFPWNMSLGAIQDEKLIEKTGYAMAEQAKRMGVQFNFAPVLDVNVNPLNPIIGNRSFGEDPHNVAHKGVALLKGLQKGGIFATGKHFPGHGDTSVDSHHTLPFLNFDRKRLDAVELYPYKSAIKAGLASVMVAHLDVPALEKEKGVPTSLSYSTITELLKEDFDFEGLIFTDALNMKGASSYKSPGEVDLAAFLAGNDVMLFSENVPLAIEKFKEAYEKDAFSDKRLASSVKKILKYKYYAGLNKYRPIDLNYLVADLNAPKYDALNRELFDNMITIAKKEVGEIPIRDLEFENIAYVKLGDGDNQSFLNTLNNYKEITVLEADSPSLLADLKGYSKVIVGYHKEDGAWKKQTMSASEIAKLQAIAAENTVYFTVFARPYVLLDIKDYTKINNLIVAYQNVEPAQQAAADVIFGGIGAKGELPVSIAPQMPYGTGFKTVPLKRLATAYPENVGMSSIMLQDIDVIANRAIAEKMTPGIQVVVARKGKIVYQKSFGYQDYTKTDAITNTDIYDLASLTKILATLPMMMRAYEQNKYEFTDPLGKLMPVFRNSDKEKITVQDMLLHQARLYPWIGFYLKTLDANKQPLAKYYRQTYATGFSAQVSENLYLRNDYNDTILKTIATSKLLPKKEYKYTDFSFIIFKEYLEKEYKTKLDVLVDATFYNKMGANTLTYNPLKKFDVSRIPPTEEDNYFRHTKVQGYVHDMAAAMQNGVSGHAGLFGNATDVAKMMQMYLQKGYYGGDQFIAETTLDAFNTCYNCNVGNRRGLGFDKPQLGNLGPTCGCTSKSSFGHTGFTGTMTWADPDKELVYVFLSNRTYPNANTNLLSKNNIREDIQRVIYDAIQD
ncbi:serine hydrolase [Flavobacterium agricola]|uniref:beta-N-acetylhexosaminidase n=1 Tax=Flavobacterium agricola TaxID=2870839 RepID=A0ABY6M4D8_9FLAO|nr:glycoside hydrolase family 3 N-terminal domain-containing protein [Flavobacterium agricola]UYW02226.1 serine hydrolase [Flavobacterium agricola]